MMSEYQTMSLAIVVQVFMPWKCFVLRLKRCMPGFGSVSWGVLFSWSGLVLYSGKYLSCDSMFYPDLSAALLFQTEHLLLDG